MAHRCGGRARTGARGIRPAQMLALPLLFCMAALPLGRPVHAETLILGSLPGNPTAVGFVVSFEVEPTSGSGYHPVYVNFRPLGKAFRRDRQVEVILEPRNYARTKIDFRIRRPITLPEGSGPLSVPVYVPTYYPWETLSVEITEDGQKIDKGKITLGLPNLRYGNADQKTLVGILTTPLPPASPQPWHLYPDVRTLVTVLGDGPLPEDVDVKRLDHATAEQQAQAVQPAWVQFRPVLSTRLQRDWLGYSQLDVILVAAPLLEDIEANQPERFADLMSWLASGGNLWVYAAGRAKEDAFLSTLDLVDVSKRNKSYWKSIDTPLDLRGDNDGSNLMREGWGGVIKSSQSYARGADMSFDTRAEVQQALADAGHPFAAKGNIKDVMKGVGRAPYGLGYVTSIQQDDPFPGSYQFWNAVAKSQDYGQLIFSERVGVDVPAGNANYWMWLIPSVGQPPVKSFVLLNTLFVLLIGPICYWVLRKRHRLYFLYFVAPALALVVTVSLFAYAVGSDGTVTKVRSRQLTWIDQSNGYHVDQNRQTYYAVLGSGGGIDVTTDTAVFPVRNTPAYNRHYRRHGRSGRVGDLLVNEDHQVMSDLFLPPRNQVQYLTLRPRASDREIAVDIGPDSRTVKNGLDFDLTDILVSDGSGRLWRAQEIAAGATADLVSVNSDALDKVLGADVVPPLGEVPMLRGNVVSMGGGMGGIQVSQLERRLEQWSRRLPPGAFVAKATVDEGRTGVEEARILDSVRLIMGRFE